MDFYFRLILLSHFNLIYLYIFIDLIDLTYQAIAQRLYSKNTMEDFYSQKEFPYKSNSFLVKCFRCTGTNKSDQCIQCRGSQMISSQHPLAVLLSNILDTSLKCQSYQKNMNNQNKSGNFLKKDQSPLLPHKSLDKQSEDQSELRDTQMQTISQQYEDQESDRMQAFQQDQFQFRMNRKNSSIAKYFQQQKSQKNAQSPAESVVRLEIDGLFSCFDTNCSAIVSKDKIPRIQPKNQIDKENMNMRMTFADYCCDCCQSQPIEGARYHCKTCVDFDICQKCYQQGDFIHQHTRFEKIEHRLTRQQQEKQLREKIALQRTRLKAGRI